MSTTQQDTQEQQGTQALRNKLYTEAQATLRERHEDEFVELITALYSAHGLTYRRRLSEEAKAEQQVRELIARYPGLAAKFGASTEGTGEA